MESLPRELLFLIAEHIQTGPRPQSSLHALSLCCRHFHHVFSPLIYHSISADDFSVKFVGLIMRLWKHPELAHQVRHLELCWSDCSQESFDGYENETEVSAFVEGALDEIFTPEEASIRSDWEEHFDSEYLCAEAWLGLLLVRTSHLQTITFGHENSELMSTLLHKAANRQQPFDKATPFPYLREVRACVAWGASWIDSGFLLPLFYLPAVQVFYGTAIGEQRDDLNMTLAKPYTSCPVREIIVDEAYWCKGMLDWLSLCAKLQHISIKIDVQADEYEIRDDDKFDASLFRALLLPSASTLKTFRIGYGDWYRDQLEEHDAIDAPFGTFKDFVVLEDITVRHSHLMGRLGDDSTEHWDIRPLVETMPCSLKRLRITDLMEEHLSQLLAELLELVQLDTCTLELLVLYLDSEDDDDAISDALSSLKSQCVAREVCFKIEAQEDC